MQLVKEFLRKPFRRLRPSCLGRMSRTLDDNSLIQATKANKAGGLPPMLEVAIGSRVMLRLVILPRFYESEGSGVIWTS